VVEGLRLEIPGIEILEPLGRGAFGVVLRARRAGRDVALKLQTIQGEDPRRLWREASGLARVSHPGLPAVLDAGIVDDQFYLAMELVEGTPLSVLLEEGPLSPERALTLGVELADVLAAVHRARLVHRDIKPANVLIDGSGRPHLIDFGFAVGATEEGAVGTPLYAAPEQTGMLSRPVDARSDLYSLGVVLFHAAVGHPPFESADPGELIRMHAVESVPELPAQIPAVLRTVVERLLAKDPDDRLQSAVEVVAALKSRPSPGRSSAFLHPLVGRSEELGVLQEAGSAAAVGQGSVVVVTGPSGMGKSRLVEEIIGPSTTAWSARCTPDEPRPLAVFLQAIEGWWRGGQRDVEVIRSALGDDAPILASVGGTIRDIVGAEVVPVPSTRTQLLGAVGRLVQGIARSRGPLVWFIDGVQWLDSETAALLESLSHELSELPLLLVLAGRTEPGDDGAVEALVSRLDHAVARHIDLKPLTRSGIEQLLAAELGAVDEELLGQLYRRSEGWPFATHEYLRVMFETGVLHPRDGRWHFDADALRHLDLPADVVSLVVARVGELSAGATGILSFAAIGVVPTTVERVAAIAEVSEQAAAAAIEESLDFGLVEPAAEGGYVFVHDGVREALLRPIDDAGRSAAHRAWADALQAESGEGLAVHAYAHHAWEGGLDYRPDRVFDAQRRAAEAAFSQSAFERAHELYERASTAASVAGIPVDGSFALRRGEACARAGRMGLANEWLTRGLEVATDPLERAELQLVLSRIELGRLDSREARMRIEQGMRELGATVVGPGVGSLFSTLWAVVRSWVGERVPALIPKLDPAARARVELLLELHTQIGVAAYFDIDTLSVVQAIGRSRRYAQQLQRGTAYARWAARASVMLALLRRRSLSNSLHEEALEIVTRAGDPFATGFVMTYRAFAVHFLGDTVEAAEIGRTVLGRWGGTMENFDHLTLCADLTWNLLMRGYVQEGAKWLALGLGRAALTPSDLTEGHTYRCYAGPVHAMLGQEDVGRGHLDAFAELIERSPPDRWRSGQHLAHRMLFLVISGETGESFEAAAAQFSKLGLAPSRTPLQLRQAWVAMAYARLRELEAGRGSPGAVDDSLRQLWKAANHPTLKAHYYVVQGGSLALAERYDAADQALNQATQLAAKTDNPWVEYEVALRRSQMRAAQGLVDASKRQVQIACQLARSHGWARRVRDLRAEVAPSSVARSMRAGDLQVRRNLEVLLEVGRASASILDLDKKAEVVLTEVLRLVGAESALLYFERDGELELFAGRDVHGEPIADDAGASRSVIDDVYASGESIVFTGSADGRVQGTESILANDLRSIAAAPLTLQDRVLGVLYVDTSLARGVFTEQTGEILAALARQLALGFETARLAGLEVAVQTERAKAQLAEEVRTLSGALNSSLELGDVAAAFTTHVGRILPVDAHLLIVERRDQWVVVSSGGSGTPEHGVQDSAWSAVQTSDRALRVAAPEGAEAAHWLAVSLRVRGQAVGVLAVGSASGDYSDEQVALLDAVSGQVATALENARLFGEIQRTNTRLEERVQTRTQELTQSLVRLELEVDERRLAEGAAQVANRAKSAFLANMSHELRTPLNAIMGYSEIVRDELEDRGEEELLPDLDRIRSAGDALLEIIDEVLDLTRIEADDLGLEIQPVEVAPVVDRLFASLSALAISQNTTLDLEIASDATAVLADPRRFRQALGKLIDNAVHFTEGGEVTVSSLRDGGRIHVVVQDTGVGIEADLRGRIFERFTQGDDAPTRTHGGAGLGLAIASELVEKMGGQITVESVVGQGSRFTLDLPAPEGF